MGWEEFEDERTEMAGVAAVSSACMVEGTGGVKGGLGGKEGGSRNGNVEKGGEDGKKGRSGNGDSAKAGRIDGFAGVR